MGRIRAAQGLGPRRTRRHREGSRSAEPRSSLVPGAVAVRWRLWDPVWWVVRFAQQRKRPTLDWDLRFVLTGTVCLVPVRGAGECALRSASRPDHARRSQYVVPWRSAAGVSLTIVGMMLKIVPFLVWYRAYAPHVGREPVPTLAQLSWRGVPSELAYGLLTASTLGLAATVAAGEPRPAIAVTGTIVSIGALAFAAALARTLLHLRPHRREPSRPGAPGTAVTSPFDEAPAASGPASAEGPGCWRRGHVRSGSRARSDGPRSELSLSVVDLGLICSIEIEKAYRSRHHDVSTTPGLPLHEAMTEMRRWRASLGIPASPASRCARRWAHPGCRRASRASQPAAAVRARARVLCSRRSAGL